MVHLRALLEVGSQLLQRQLHLVSLQYGYGRYHHLAGHLDDGNLAGSLVVDVIRSGGEGLIAHLHLDSLR